MFIGTYETGFNDSFGYDAFCDVMKAFHVSYLQVSDSTCREIIATFQLATSRSFVGCAADLFVLVGAALSMVAGLRASG